MWTYSLLRILRLCRAQRGEACAKLSGLLLLCPLLLICDDWKQVTAHLTACVLWYSCYAESSTCKHLHDSCLLRVSVGCMWHLGSTFTTPFVHGIALLYQHTVKLEGSTKMAGDTHPCLARSMIYFKTFVNYLKRISRHNFWRILPSLWKTFYSG